MSTPSNRARLEALAQQLKRNFDDTRALRRLRDITAPHDRRIATAYDPLDRLLNIGGVPRGHIITFSSQPTSGALTLALQMLVAAQQRGELVAWVDCLGAFDADYAFRCGLDIDRTTFVHPRSLLDALAIMATLARHGSISLLLVDYLPVLWQNGSAETLALGLRRLRPALLHSRASAIFLTEADYDHLLRDDAAVHLRLTRQAWLRRRGDIAGVVARVQVEKNKFGRDGIATTLEIPFPEDGL